MRVGLPRMHKEAGERRDLLPPFVAALCRDGATEVVLEDGYGAAMDLLPADYRRSIRACASRRTARSSTRTSSS